MKSVDINYFTDNQAGEAATIQLKKLGLNVNRTDIDKISSISPDPDKVTLIVADIDSMPVSDIIEKFNSSPKLHNIVKYIVLDSSLIVHAGDYRGSAMHTEFIEKPYNRYEFALLIEKSIIVEKYRQIMKQLSNEYEKRIEQYENIFHISNSDVIATDQDKKAFEKILDFEKNLIKKQEELNEKLHDFSSFRQKDLLETQNLLFANTMLDRLREKELMDANELIHAQERVLEYSSSRLGDNLKLVEAQEKVVELSRDEAISLHHTIENLIKEKKYLIEENQKLKDLLQKK
ncbi:MAG: hypothetical protein JXK07_07280 [Spirochaetes bacterium]|nr:hypothetical protein [Spirochaetota bacterium]MBN2769656.1 hypothetical protein [Spirochaetota bacterium]